MTEKPYVDIGFIIPLREEFESLAKIFPRLEQYVEGVQFSTKVSLGVDGLSELHPVPKTPSLVFYGTGGASWREGSLRESSSLRLSG